MGRIPRVQCPEAYLSLEDTHPSEARLNAPKKGKLDPATLRKSPPRKVLVTPVSPVEETWDTDLVEIELSYSEPASPAHIKGVTFASPQKVPPVNETEQAHEYADHLIPEEDIPQLGFIEETLTTNDRITEDIS